MQIYILLTEKCNLHCSMCIRGRQSGKELDLTELKKVIRENDFSRDEIVISGGEPSLHPQFAEIVDFFCDSAAKVGVATNGTQTSRLAKIAQKENLFFQISLDGHSDQHEEIRGKGAYSETWRTIELFEQERTPYTIATVISRKNSGNIKRLVDTLSELKSMKYWNVSFEMPFGSAGFENMMSAEEWNDFVDEMLDYVPFKMKIKKIFPFELYSRRKDDLLRIRNSRGTCMNCGGGVNKIYIYPDFEVYPCTCLTDFSLGNLKENKLEEILHSEKTSRFSSYELCEDSICKSCEYVEFCNGGCIGMSYHYFGKLGMGDIRCPKINKKK